MWHDKMITKQLDQQGLRPGDSFEIWPWGGRKKVVPLKRTCLDFVASEFRPLNLSSHYIELSTASKRQFHFRIQLDEGLKSPRYAMRSLSGHPFWVNGLVTKEAYIERADQVVIDDHRMQFNSTSLLEWSQNYFEHPILKEDKIIHSQLSVMIEGETGTGKTYLAEKIHHKGNRSGEWVHLNLSALSPQLIESELFGHIKGAFTGAIKDHAGAIRTASNGTLFIDEIDSLPLDLQAKLLLFLDNQKIRPVGSDKEVSITTRLIFASGKNLETLVQKGLMRRDFYFRLKTGLSLSLPPLRNNIEQIKIFCQKYALDHQCSFTERVLEFYQTLPWPGNVRQLKSHLEKKRILSKNSKLDFDEHDQLLLEQTSDIGSFSDEEIHTLESVKRKYIERAMAICHGQISLAAKKLEIHPKTVRMILNSQEGM